MCRDMLTGKEIYSSGLITGALEENVQQHGIDLRVENIRRVSGIGVIPAEGKTEAPIPVDIKPIHESWSLVPGYYEVEFVEGCNLDSTHGMLLKSRSSLVRCGGAIRSGYFDPGFHTEHIGAYMVLEKTIIIECGARLAQVLITQSNEVTNTYDGQWQNDKQREFNEHNESNESKVSEE